MKGNGSGTYVGNRNLSRNRSGDGIMGNGNGNGNTKTVTVISTRNIGNVTYTAVTEPLPSQLYMLSYHQYSFRLRRRCICYVTDITGI